MFLFRLNLDPRQADQQIRGTLVLPHGNGKTKKVLAITTRVQEALDAGADFAGGKETLERIKTENWFDYDVLLPPRHDGWNLVKWVKF